MTSQTREPLLVRRAGPQDAEELTRLRALMLGSLEGRTVGLDEDWAPACVALLRAQLLPQSSVVAMVVDAPDGSGLASSGFGVLDLRLPAPGRVSARVGHLSSMSTDPRWRRRGYATAIVDALLAWFVAQGCGRAELHASDDGLPIYLSRGFVPSPNPELRRPFV